MHTFAAATVLQLDYKTGGNLETKTVQGKLLSHICENAAQFILKQNS